MGTYLYTLRAEKRKLRLENKENVPVHLLKFACRYSTGPSLWDHPGGMSPTEKHIARAEAFWCEIETPKYVTIGETFEHGSPIYKDWPDGMAYCPDHKWPGTFVGYLVKVGRSWAVSTDPKDNGWALNPVKST